jgi:O-antigen/teichoic acid export membrane protein
VTLPSHLIPYAKKTLFLLIPTGLTYSLMNMYTGVISYNRKTVSLLTSTMAQLSVVFVGLVVAIGFWKYAGIFAVGGVSLIASLVQLLWLYFSNRKYLKNI